MTAVVMRLEAGITDVDCDGSQTTLNDRDTSTNTGEVKSNDEGNLSHRPHTHSNKWKHNQQSQNQHHRRKQSKRKRKWKPYSKMTWEEKKAVEERERVRADRIREEMMRHGRPVAPYNTTQFIMNEHDPYEEDSYVEGNKESTGNDACNSKSPTSGMHSAKLNCSDSPCNEDDLIEAEYTDSPHMAPEFISQDFSEAYERVQEESLSIMSRDDLVREHLSLERTLSYLQGKLAEEKGINNSYCIKVQNVEEELKELRENNRRLFQENMCLRYGEGTVHSSENEENQTFLTSDCEYEAPNEETESVNTLGIITDDPSMNAADFCEEQSEMDEPTEEPEDMGDLAGDTLN